MPAWCRRAGSNCLIGAYETPALPLSYTDIWQARQGSNLRMRDSKSRAFPLGDAPIFAFSANKSGAACGYRSRFPGLKDQDASQYTNAAYWSGHGESNSGWLLGRQRLYHLAMPAIGGMG